MGEWLVVGGGGLACHCSPSLGDKLTFTHAARLGEQAEAGWRHRLSLKAGVDCLPHEPGHLPKYPHTHAHTQSHRGTPTYTDNGRGDDVLSMPTKCGIVAQALSLACSLSNRLSVCVCVCVCARVFDWRNMLSMLQCQPQRAPLVNCCCHATPRPMPPSALSLAPFRLMLI